MGNKYGQKKIVMGGVSSFIRNFFVVLFLFFLNAASSSSVLAAGTNSLTVVATVISKNICKFKSKGETLNFGAIDPAGVSNITSTTTVDFVCNGSSSVATYALSSDDGLYETGPGANRMRNTSFTTEYLPYTLSFSPQSGTIPKGVTQTFTISGTVTPSNYRSAYIGNYTDTVVVSINP
jgi:hypothetical protein